MKATYSSQTEGTCELLQLRTQNILKAKFVFVVLALVLDFTVPWEVPFHSGTKYTPLDNRVEPSFDALAWPLTGFLTAPISRKLRLVPQSP